MSYEQDIAAWQAALALPAEQAENKSAAQISNMAAQLELYRRELEYARQQTARAQEQARLALEMLNRAAQSADATQQMLEDTQRRMRDAIESLLAQQRPGTTKHDVNSDRASVPDLAGECERCGAAVAVGARLCDWCASLD